MNVVSFDENTDLYITADGIKRKQTIDEILDGVLNNIPSDYHYEMSVSNYNPLIDSSVTVTVQVTDSHNEIAEDYEFTIDLNGFEVTLTTDDEGIATYTYTCREWGVQTFRIGENTIQINVTGLKLVSESPSSFGGDYKLYVDEANRNAVAKLEINNKNIGTGTDNYVLNDFVPEKYRPKASQYSFGDRYLDVIFWIFNNGNAGVSNIKGSTLSNATVSCELDWNF